MKFIQTWQRFLNGFPCFYASAFRRRRHYVFGLSVRPSVRSLKYPLLTCTWVRWSTRPTVTVLRHVRPSVRPSVRPERFPGICRRMHGGIGLKFYMLMYLDHLQNWLVYGCGLLIFSCDQAALWMVFSVRPSVCPSVRLSHLFDYVPIIVSSWNFQELSHWTRVRSMQKVKVKGQGHRGHDPNFRFRTVTPVWIHIWWWNDTYSLMMLRRGALLFFKVIHQVSRSHGAKIAEFDLDWAFPDCNSSLNSPMAMKCCTKLEVA